MVKALVVSSIPCNEVKKCLRAAGSHITTAQDGQEAISHVAHASFDLTVLVSTGKGMDVVETYFNLRDINPWMEIVLLCDDEHGAAHAPTADLLAHAFPNTRLLTIDGLARLLGVRGDKPS